MVNLRAVAAVAVSVAVIVTVTVLFITPGYASLLGDTYNENNSSDVEYITISLGENQYSGAVTSEIKYHTLTEIGDGGRVIQYVPEYEETITVSEVHTVKSVNDTIYTVDGGTYDGVKFIVTDNEHNYVTVIDQNGNTVAIDTELKCGRDRDVTEVVVFDITLDAPDTIPTYSLHISVDDENKMTGTFYMKYTIDDVDTFVVFPPSTGITIDSLTADSIEVTLYVHSAEISPGDEPVPPLDDVAFVFRAEVSSS